jgi:hypothetical protein
MELNNLTGTEQRSCLKVKERLEAIKKMMDDDKKINKLSAFKDELGGAALFYTVLNNKGIINKPVGGFYCWKHNVPITMILANTVRLGIASFKEDAKKRREEKDKFFKETAKSYNKQAVEANKELAIKRSGGVTLDERRLVGQADRINFLEEELDNKNDRVEHLENLNKGLLERAIDAEKEFVKWQERARDLSDKLSKSKVVKPIEKSTRFSILWGLWKTEKKG